MLANAISKIKTEMDQNKNNSYIQVVGGFLLQHLERDPEAAGKIMAEGKTIAKSLDAMRDEASKKKVGNCAMFTPAEGFEIAMKYFGIEAAAPGAVPGVKTVNIPAPVPPVQRAGIDFDIKLEDLL
jgi:hypothetical protein